MRKSAILLSSILIMVTVSSCTQEVREEGDKSEVQEVGDKSEVQEVGDKSEVREVGDKSNVSAEPRYSNSRQYLPRHFFYNQR